MMHEKKNMNVTGHKVVDSSPVEGVNCSPDLAYFSPLLLRHFLAANIPSPHPVQLGGRPALMSFYWGIRDRDQVAAKYCCYHTEVVSFRKSKISTSDILHHHKDSISLTSCPSSVWVGSWDSKYESTSIQNRQEYDRTDKMFGKLRTDFKQNLDIFRVLNFWSRHRNYIVLNI